MAASKSPFPRPAYIITGPTSGIGLVTALEVAKHGTIVLVGRDQVKIDAVRRRIEQQGGNAISVQCDLSNMESVVEAVKTIVGSRLPLAGLVNNAGIHQTKPTKSAQGWDMTFATDHLGPFVLTEALLPHMPDGANIVFVASGVEDPERKPAKMAGFRGGRYISAEASARGEWQPGGATAPGADAYATSKQCTLATALELARESPRLHVNAVEPGFNPATSLGREANPFVRFLLKYVLTLFAPFVKYWSTPKQAAQVITQVLLNVEGVSGVYYDDEGKPMLPSALVRKPDFGARVVSETRTLVKDFLAAAPSH